MTAYLKILNLILLLVYSSYVFRSVFPLVDYVINFNFIVSELCEQKDNPENMCMGKCHLQKEMKKQVDEEGSKKQLVVLENIKFDHIAYSNAQSGSQPTFIKFFISDFKSANLLPCEPLLPPPKILSNS